MPTWATFGEGLLVRFGPSAFEDIDGELAKILQTSSVSEYQSQLERLANRAGDWPETQLISTFVEGLRPDIRRAVKTYQPRTIATAFSFARVHKEKLSEETRRTTLAFSRPAIGGNSSSSAPTRKTTCLNQEEIKEKTVKGLCWHCDAKWYRGYVCKQGKLLMIEPMVEQMAPEIGNDRLHKKMMAR